MINKFFKMSFLIALVSLLGCSKIPPTGEWEATEAVKVLVHNDRPHKIAFMLEKGDICAISPDWQYRKDLGYKEVDCNKGKGWITNDRKFKNLLSDKQ